jgi:uncharacterized protein YgiM (DUF1202 family)
MYIALMLLLVAAARATAQDSNPPAADATPVPTAAVTASEGTTGVVVDTPILNVRSGPGLLSPRITTLVLGQNIPLIGRDTVGGWLQMRLDNGSVGWVSSRFIRSDLPLTELPVVDTTALASAPNTPAVGMGAVLQVAEPFNVRSGPGLDFPVLATLAASRYYVLTGRNADGSWLYIRLADGSTGWVSNTAATAPLDLANLPVSTAAPALAASPSITTTEPAPGIGGLALGTANPSVLYVRTGPGLNYTFLDTLAQNQAVTLEGRTADGAWLQVRLPDGGLGWVSSAFMTVNLAIADLPVVEPTAPAIVTLPTATSTAPGVGGQALGTVVNAANLNVRTGPGLNFTSVGVVPLGTSLVLEGRNASGLWLQVRLADGSLGWVSRTFMEPNLNVANLPVTG